MEKAKRHLRNINIDFSAFWQGETGHYSASKGEARGDLFPIPTPQCQPFNVACAFHGTRPSSLDLRIDQFFTDICSQLKMSPPAQPNQQRGTGSIWLNRKHSTFTTKSSIKTKSR